MNIALGIGRINSAHETDILNNEENDVYVIFKQASTKTLPAYPFTDFRYTLN